MSVKPIPEGHSTVSPFLVVTDVPRLIEFLARVFDAREIHRTLRPDGGIRHAEVRIGDTVVMMGQAGAQSPPVLGMLHVYVTDADAVYRRALDAGATSLREPADQFYGDRMGGVLDAFGNQWWIATHVEDVSADELVRRQRAAS